MFITTFFTTAKLWDHSRCPSADGYWSILEFYLAIKKNEIMSFSRK
jgi:hypothetical protein